MHAPPGEHTFTKPRPSPARRSECRSPPRPSSRPADAGRRLAQPHRLAVEAVELLPPTVVTCGAAIATPPTATRELRAEVLGTCVPSGLYRFGVPRPAGRAAVHPQEALDRFQNSSCQIVGSLIPCPTKTVDRPPVVSSTQPSASAGTRRPGRTRPAPRSQRRSPSSGSNAKARDHADRGGRDRGMTHDRSASERHPEPRRRGSA